MRRKLLVAVLAVVAVAAVALWQWPRPSIVPDAEPPLDGDRATLVGSLVHEMAKGDGGHESAFFRALEHVTSKEKSVNDSLLAMFWRDGRAVEVSADGRTYVVAIVHGVTPFIPGEDIHDLQLFSAEGQLMDVLRCSISNRLTSMFLDGGRTEMVVQGAEFNFRYIPPVGEHVSGNWETDVSHGDRVDRIQWESQSAEVWESQGLCRVAVGDGGFRVVFPNPAAAPVDTAPTRNLPRIR